MSIDVKPGEGRLAVPVATQEVGELHYPLYMMVDESGAKVAYIDLFSGAIGTITQTHLKVHEGKFYQYTLDTTVAQAGGVLNILLKSNGSYPHYQYMKVNSGGNNVDIELFEEPTVTDEGTLVTTIRNHNRNSSNVPSTELYLTPTVSADGELLESDWLHGTRVEGVVGGSGDYEWNLKALNYSMLRITNNTTGAGSNRCVIKIAWYE